MRASKQCLLPDLEWLRNETYWPSGRPVYNEEEIAQLSPLIETFNEIADEEKRRKLGMAMVRRMWPTEAEFIRKQHTIETKQAGRVTMLEWNYVQRGFFKLVEDLRAAGKPVRIITLKARQLGQSTAIQSWFYEQCTRQPHRRSMTIAHDDAATIEMFQKAHTIHNNLWFPPAVKSLRNNRIEMENGSVFLTQTAGNLNAGRSYTVHNCHISELPMWPNAEEVLDGLLNSISKYPDSMAVIESTAKGTGNEFYTMWVKAENKESDWTPYFAPWYWSEEYSLNMTEAAQREFARSMSREERKYMETWGIAIPQMAWRRKTIKDDCRGSERKFRQEYPACAQEAFLSSGRPAFDQEKLMELERNATAPLWKGHIYLQGRPMEAVR